MDLIMLWGMAFILFVGIVTLLLRAHHNTKVPSVNHVNLKVGERKERLHILHLSDLHMEHISISPEEIFQMVGTEPIDLIALTGDYLEKESSITKFASYLEVLQRLQPKYGIYAVWGNHDYKLSSTMMLQLEQVMKAYDVVLLVNENRTIWIDEEPLQIVGIDDAYSGHDDIVSSFQGVINHPRMLTIVLTHDPHTVWDLKRYHYHYLLCGHFHGGQINWPRPYHLAKMGPMWREDIIKGLHYYNDRAFYINEGLGQTGVNIRLRSRPEITLHQIY
ncbi:metallophosphoesterase [Rubeoparvulum massiliense]|uniref:metallophosphoesterase n=1 Tax=Rubeoparvulum massiliense TaxID=1631346 RepID=UPI000975B94F|nr:metallophosphoesterase [Rubeoparvulum massiliense]